VYPVPEVAVSVTAPPAQNDVAPPAEMVAVGGVFTVTVIAVEVVLHPAEVVTCTV
jgi:hypothetical protein